MSSCKLDFNFTTDGLKVIFKNYSMNVPCGYKMIWDFGNGGKSMEEDPIYVYAKPGIYKVSLTLVDNLGNVINKVSQEVLVTDKVKTHLSGSIYQLIDTYIPESIFGEIPISKKRQFIEKWQLYIQPLVNHCIPIEEFNNESYYEALENQLIMELAAYDFMVISVNHMIQAINSTLTQNNISSAETSTNVTEDGEAPSGAIKKVKTGPTEVEYFDPYSQESDTTTALLKALQPGGFIDVIKENLCMLAERLDIYLPICKAPAGKVIPPRVVNRRKPGFLGGPNPMEIIR